MRSISVGSGALRVAAMATLLRAFWGASPPALATGTTPAPNPPPAPGDGTLFLLLGSTDEFRWVKTGSGTLKQSVSDKIDYTWKL